MSNKYRLTAILILSLLVFTFALSPARADDDPESMKVYGFLEDSVPAYPGPGDWIVDGVTYKADDDTDFETEHGDFEVGTCVEVKYIVSGDFNYAKEIESEHDYKCWSDDTEYRKVYGLLGEPIPDFPGPGVWIVNGFEYQADENTQFEQEHGDFEVGSCVEVKYVEEETTKRAIKIETESPYHCDGEDLTKFYGLIEKFPENLEDYSFIWVIGGMNFKFNVDTNLDQSKAEFAENVCVEVLYYLDAEDANVAKKIKSKSTHHCGKGSYTQNVYGFIKSLPINEDLIGEWTIDETVYVVSESTHLKESVRKFSVGQCVKVKYFTSSDADDVYANGVNHAVEIKTEKDKKCDGSGGGLPGESKIIGKIDAFPWPPSEYDSQLPYVDVWIISETEFIATETTVFEQTDQLPFAVGACVEAKYTTEDDGINIWNTLISVETQEPYMCENHGYPHPSEFLFTAFGAIVSMSENDDPNDLTEVWNIGGASYIVGEFTNFSEDFGNFAIGTYVKVKYVVITNDKNETVRLALSVETHVAPGAGMMNVQGILTSHDSSDQLNDWVVDGVPYVADSAIDVGKKAQEPKVGELVVLNVYEVNGVQYVTSIQAPYYLFQPMISH
jgi:hypothetical protein